MAFVFTDESSDRTDAILDSFGDGAKAFVPHLWRWEVANALFQAERRKRITPSETSRHLISFQTLPIELDEAASAEAWNAALLLARKHVLSVYDATYLELAIRRGLSLGSLDHELRKAALTEKVQLLPEVL